ncbi:MAG: hypothetical protein F4X20_04490 [Dehalococcoidia bacterium]|nr:hypothetical protein [Dehalococcoidia bacterium]
MIERMRNIHEVLHSLRVESSEIDFEEVVSPFIEQWRSDNPDLAQDLDRVGAQVLSVMREAARGLEFMFIQISAGVNQWMRNNPEALRKLVVILRILASDSIASEWHKRREKEGVTIPFDESVGLAIGLMTFRIPYSGTRRADEGNLATMYDYEMRAVDALRTDRFEELIEGAQSSPVDFRALREVLSHLLETHEPVPDELVQWSLSVAAGRVTSPSTGPGRSRYKNQHRDELIAQTVQTLVDCGLKATRNEASAPESACDAVSTALNAHGVELSYAGVAKIWQSSRRQKLAPQNPSPLS